MANTIGVIAAAFVLLSMSCVVAPNRWVKALGIEPIGRPRF